MNEAKIYFQNFFKFHFLKLAHNLIEKQFQEFLQFCTNRK